jgi:putative component of toxin-antitoxin plasmid stabilization module
MYFIEKTSEFDKWFRKLKDLRAKAKNIFRVQKLEQDEHFEIVNQLAKEYKKL